MAEKIVTAEQVLGAQLAVAWLSARISNGHGGTAHELDALKKASQDLTERYWARILNEPFERQ